MGGQCIFRSGELKTPIGHKGGNVHPGAVETKLELQAEVQVKDTDLKVLNTQTLVEVMRVNGLHRKGVWRQNRRGRKRAAR